MGPSTLALALLGSLTLHVQETSGVSDETLASLLEGLEAEVASLSGQPIERGACADADCGGKDALRVSVLGGLSRLTVVAERLHHGSVVTRGEATGAVSDLRLLARDLAQRLFPAPALGPEIKDPSDASLSSPPPIATEVNGDSVLQWVAIGVGATAVGVGLTFVLLANGTQNDLDAKAYYDDEVPRLENRLVVQRTTAVVLLATAGVAVAAALIFGLGG